MAPTTMQLYNKDLPPHSPLDVDVENDLIAKAQTGDMIARDKIIETHLRLVMFVAIKYTYTEEPFEDLVSYGNMGLMHAVKKFDATKGCRFSTYAVWWIRQFINRHILQSCQGPMHIPVNLSEKIAKMRHIQKELQHTLGRIPTNDEVAAKMHIPVKRLVLWQQSIPHYDYIDEDSTNDSDSNKYNDHTQLLHHTPVNAYDTVHDTKALLDGTNLTDDERLIITMRYLNECTLQEVGNQFGLSRERVRQIEWRALRKVRKYAYKSRPNMEGMK